MSKVNTVATQIKYKTKVLCVLLANRRLTMSRALNFVRNKLNYILRIQPAVFRPSILFLEPTVRCNLSCIGCANTRQIMYKGKMGDITTSHIKKTIEGLDRTLQFVILYWNGEPLLHAGITEIVKELSGKNISTMISTNGMRLSRAMSQELVDSGIDIIKIALSGVTQDVYSIYHRKGNIDQVITNIRNLAAIVKGSGREVLIIVDYLKFRWNTHEVQAAIELCGNLGVQVNIRNAYETHDNKDEAEKIMDVESSSGPCEWLWQIGVVNWQGLVYPCCQVGAVQHDLIMGSMEDDSLFNSLNSAAYRHLRASHINGRRDAYKACRECYYEGLGFQ